jgi:glycosyltransferase involved in cell wall biosynthesis
MRFVLISTHVDQTTGYSKVVYNLLGQLATLAPAVKTYHFGFQRLPARSSIRVVPKSVVAYDAAANEDPKEEGFGFNKIHEYLEMVNPDVVMIYNDPLIIHRFVEAMKFDKETSPYKLWVYVDQVYEGIAPPLIETITKNAHRVYCFTKYWADIYADYAPFPDIRVLENAVDTTLFSKLPDAVRTSIRATMGIGPEAVLFVNANRNSQRKRHDLAVMGFVELLKRNPTKPYYFMVVTGLNGQQGAYYDLSRVYAAEMKRQGLDVAEFAKRLLLVDTSAKPVPDSSINEIYNAADIGVNTSDGEGFGLCQIEHLYTGAPQIVTDIGTYRSFMNTGVCGFVKPVDRVYFSGTMPLGLWAPTFDYRDLANEMETMIANLPRYKDAALHWKFKTWDEVCAGWIADIKAETQSKSR